MARRAAGGGTGRAGAPGEGSVPDGDGIGGGVAGGLSRRGLLLPVLALPGVLAARGLPGAPAVAAPAPGRTGAAGTGGAAGPGGAVAGREIAATVRLRPGGAADAAVLRAEGLGSRLVLEAGSLLLPGAPDRVASLPLAGRQVVAAGVALASGQVLAVLAGWDGTQMRILGVESWDWHGPGPRHLSLRLVAVPDDRRVRLLYDATLASPRPEGPEQGIAGPGPTGPGLAGPGLAGPGLAGAGLAGAGGTRTTVRRETWTDILAWQEGAALRSEPLRAVLAGTWQARMARTRADVAALLAAPRVEIGVAELAATGLLDPLDRVAPG
jgi:hypothetical protein